MGHDRRSGRGRTSKSSLKVGEGVVIGGECEQRGSREFFRVQSRDRNRSVSRLSERLAALEQRFCLPVFSLVKQEDHMASEKNLRELFHETLKDIYFAEKKILAALPKMAKAAQSQDLKAAFQKHEAGNRRARVPA